MTDSESREGRSFDLLQEPIDNLPLSVRTANALRINQVNNLGELVTRSEKEMLDIRWMGDKTWTEITGILQDHGIRWDR